MCMSALATEGAMLLLLVLTSLTATLSAQTRDDIRPVVCSGGSAVTEVSVDIQESSSQPDTAAVLTSLARYTHLPTSAFSQLTTLWNTPHKATVMASGRGNALPSNEMLRVTWVVGCGSVTERMMTLLQHLETDAEDGTLAATLGHDVTGWHVTNVRPGDSVSRAKRASERGDEDGEGYSGRRRQGTGSRRHEGSRHWRKKHKRPVEEAESSGHGDTAEHQLSLAQPKLAENNKASNSALVPTVSTTPVNSQLGDKPVTVTPMLSKSPKPRTSTLPQGDSDDSDDIIKTTKPKRPGSRTRKSTESHQASTRAAAEAAVEENEQNGDVFYSSPPASLSASQSVSTPVTSQPTTMQQPTTRLSSTPIAEILTTQAELSTVKTSTLLTTTTEPSISTSELSTSTAVMTSLLAAAHRTASTTVSPTTVSTTVSPTTTATSTVSTPLPGPAVDKAPVNGRLISHISMQAGHVVQYTLPESTFSDGEDGDTRQLTVRLLTHDYLVLPPSFWLQFDTVGQQLYGLPLAHHAGNYSLRLVATDSVGQTAEQNIIVQVVNSRHTVSRLTAEFSATIDLSYDVFANDVRKQVDVINRVATGVFGDADASAMVVLRTQRGSTEIVWSNTSLASTKCDVSAVRALQLMLTDSTYGGFSDRLVQAFYPYNILQVSSRPLGSCAKDAQLQHELTLLLSNEDLLDWPTTRQHRPGVFSTRRLPSTSWPMTTLGRRPGGASGGTVPRVQGTNAPPMLMYGLEMVGAREGQVLNRSLRADMFFDPEDGHNLHLSLNYVSGPLAGRAGSWVYVDSKRQVLLGLPFFSHVGQHEMRLTARDSGGKTTHDDFTVDVIGGKAGMQQVIAEFRLTFDDVGNHVASDVRQQVALVHTLATRVYNDANASAVTVLRIVQLSSGLVQLSWTNATFTDPRCTPSSVYALTSRLFSRDHTVSAQLTRVLLPYSLREIRFIPHRDCVEAGLTEVTVTSEAASASSPVLYAVLAHIDTHLFIYILPSCAAIIIILIIIAIACYCRRRSEAKDTSRRNRRPTFLRNGAPIIFADELDEQPESPQRPLLVPEERGPVEGVARPPGYAHFRSSPASQSSIHTCGVQSPVSQHSVHSPPPTYRRPLVKNSS